MAVTYSTTAKTARMTAVRDTWGASAKLKLYDNGGTPALLATFTLSATTADSTVSNGIITIKFTGNSASQTVTASGTGTVGLARITTSGDVDVVTGLTIGTGANDVVLNTTTIGSGSSVAITAASLTHV